jgi:flagellar hook-basal body complex protein FliE
MDVTTTLAAASYAKAKPATSPAEDNGGGIGDAMMQAVQSFTDTLATGETTARAAMTGGADPHALVQALASTQMAVETVSTLRDKVVEAYQEILRMPV